MSTIRKPDIKNVRFLNDSRFRMTNFRIPTVFRSSCKGSQIFHELVCCGATYPITLKMFRTNLLMLRRPTVVERSRASISL